MTGTWTGPVDANPAFSSYYATNVCNTSKIYRSANYEYKEVLGFSGTVAQHTTLMSNMNSKGYTRLWIEANFNYYTHVTNRSNAAKATFDLTEPGGSNHTAADNVNSFGYFTTTGSVQNTWVFLNYKIWDANYDTPLVTSKPRVAVWFADDWSQWSNTDWFQMMKWACWFSKS